MRLGALLILRFFTFAWRIENMFSFYTNASQHRRYRKIAVLTIALALLLLLPITSFSQETGPPAPGEPLITPAPGTIIVEPNYPATAPAGIDPLAGDGAIAVIPPQPPTGEDVVAVVNADLGGGIAATLLVPVQPEDPTASIVVRIQVDDPVDIPADLPEGAGESVMVLDIDVFLLTSDGGVTLITEHDPPLTLAIQVPEGVDPTTLVILRYDEETGAYQVLETTYDPVTGSLIVTLPKTSRFVMVTIEPGKTIIPGGLPKTGGGGRPTNGSARVLAISLLSVSALVAFIIKRRMAGV